MKIGTVSLLVTIFVIAKLTDAIAWPWWLVLSPVWVSAVFALVALAVLVGVEFLGG